MWKWSIIHFSSPLELEISQETDQKPLIVEGQFPTWLDGVLVRNSSIPIFKNGVRESHEFDGLAMLHSFAFNQGQVVYTNRFLLSDAYNAVVNQRTSQFAGFATKPALWQKILNFFESSTWVNNASVNVFQYGNDYVALTETPLPAHFDLRTLDTLGPFDYVDSLPKSKCWESAHPHVDLSTGDIVNYLIEFGRQSHYVFYKIKKGSKTREVIARVPVETPSYMHSFSMTPHYLILTEYPLLVKPLDLLLKNKPFIDNFRWQPEKGTRFIVIERNSGNVVSQMVTEPFFSFHHANAYEIDNGNTIILDLVAYPDVLNMPTIFPQADAIVRNVNWNERLMRYHVFLKTHKITPKILLEKSVEFPRLKDNLDGQHYRYLYLIVSEDPNPNIFKKKEIGLGKFDMDTKVFKTWSQEGYQALEPVFISSPNAKHEDDGVILSVIYHEKDGRSFLLALDAHSFDEIARAELPWHIPGSFHGQYFNETVFIPKEETKERL
jgi:beta,beta-carotene 9',10'-dioxygenase